MKLYPILLLTLSLIQATSIACDCKTMELKIARVYEYSGSDLILIGEVLHFNDSIGIAKVRIKEIFKGNMTLDSTIEVSYANFCEPYIDSFGDWLLYTSYQDSTLQLNACGLSRSLSKPENNGHFSGYIPPPPLSDSIISRDENTPSPTFLELKKNNQIKAKKLLETEILELRKKKN